jgi:hypothetical protein
LLVVFASLRYAIIEGIADQPLYWQTGALLLIVEPRDLLNRQPRNQHPQTLPFAVGHLASLERKKSETILLSFRRAASDLVALLHLVHFCYSDSENGAYRSRYLLVCMFKVLLACA